MVNGQGHAVMAFSGSRTNEYVGAYFTGRLATDSAGSMGSVAVIKSGEAAYQYIDSSGRNRWGDYSYTSLDPNDDMSLWTIQEYASSATSSNWATWVARLLAPAPTLANPAASAYQGQTGVVLNLTGTGHYDPGPGFPNRQTVALTGGSPNGISNYAVTNINATLTRVTFDVAANAALGPRDVVLTNPDGQTATVLGGFTIQAPADLSIAKTASPDPVTAGNTLAYHIVVSNRGPASSGTVTVTDPLPPGITFVSAATSQGTWTNQNGTIICELGALASNGVATVTLLTMPTQSGTIDNTASVDGSADPNGANDSATAAVTVPMDADSDGVPDAWELTHGMSSANGGDAATDPDGDGISSLIEYRAGTDPNNTTSFFRVLSVLTISNDVRITWQAGGGRTNRVQAGPSPTAFQDIGPSFVIPGETDLTTNYLDVAGGTNAPARFYRIRIQP